MDYTIKCEDFSGGKVPMILVIKRGEDFFAIDDHEVIVCSSKGAGEISQRLLDIVTHSLSLIVDGHKVEIRFQDAGEVADFSIESKGHSRFAVWLKELTFKESEKKSDVGKFWNGFYSHKA